MSSHLQRATRAALAPAQPARRVLLLDGGLGTSLEQRHGVCFSLDATPLWSSHLLLARDTSPLRRCHADFARVPVDVLLTATYQVSADGFARSGVVDAARVAHHLAIAVDVAERAVAEAAAADRGREPAADRSREPAADRSREPAAAALALSLGPYGACMVPSQEYSGRYDAPHDSRAALAAWHLDRLRLFAPVERLAQRVAYVALETLPRIDEIEAVREAMAASSVVVAALPFWISCLYPSGETLPDGATPEDAVRAMLDPAVAPGAVPWGIGINCTKVDKLDALVRRYEAAVAELRRRCPAVEWPTLVLYPDGTNGQVYDTATQAWVEAAGSGDGTDAGRLPWEQQLADVVQGAEARGLWRQIVVGGCCMASCDDIARLRALLSQRGLV